MRVAPQVMLTDEQRSRLQSAAKGRSVSGRVAERASIVLLAAEGRQDIEIAQKLSITRQTAARWRQRFLSQGFDGLLKDRPRGGRKRTARSEEKVCSIIERTTQTTPPNATHWSTRTMARAEGVSEATVRRVWKAHGLKPHRVKSFKVSNDKQFVEKLDDRNGSGS
jgi:transposase